VKGHGSVLVAIQCIRSNSDRQLPRVHGSDEAFMLCSRANRHHTTRNATVVQYREHVVTAGLRSIKTSIGFGMTNLEQPGWIHVAKSKRATLSKEVGRSQGYQHHETSVQK
jgi:hypothetical protein